MTIKLVVIVLAQFWNRMLELGARKGRLFISPY